MQMPPRVEHLAAQRLRGGAEAAGDGRVGLQGGGATRVERRSERGGVASTPPFIGGRRDGCGMWMAPPIGSFPRPVGPWV
jgi:hypothetical protein